MAKSIKKKASLSAILFFCALSHAKLIDQTVGVVGAHVITLRDMRIQSAVEYMEQYRRIPENQPSSGRQDLSTDNLSKARQSIVTDYLIQDYLSTIQVNPEIKPTDKEDLVNKIMELEKDKVETFLKQEHFSRSDVESAVERKLRLEFFLENQLAFRTNFTDPEVKVHYEKHSQDRFLGKSFSDVEGIVRADLKKEKLQLEFARWIKNQIRRTEVTVLPIPSLQQ